MDKERRKFFKNVGGLTLLGVGLIMAPKTAAAKPTEESSPESPQKPATESTPKAACDGCGATCVGSCRVTCTGSCSAGCASSCQGSCRGACMGTQSHGKREHSGSASQEAS
ncbi:hypothetical protein KKF84_04915 [Myxococcota bacterium]|nr:hypothetical protein [Myxococcota bacterium]MBU1534637.1 hypothetical protein [Myxococcota bacterium]